MRRSPDFRRSDDAYWCQLPYPAGAVRIRDSYGRMYRLDWRGVRREGGDEVA